jgi:hypothetical protein
MICSIHKISVWVSLLVLLLALDVDKAPVEAEVGAFPIAAGLEDFELLDCDLNLV